MASGTAQHGSPAPRPSGTRRNGRVVEYQQYIDTQLGRTRRRVQWVDLWTALTTLAVGFTAYLLLAAVVDHWIVPGGLGAVGRWLLLVVLAGGVVLHLVTGLAPIFVRRVNPVYAAAAIEQGGRMKNTLINFLLLRREPEAIPDGVLDVMKEQAAVRLSNVPDDAPVDRTALIRWFYVLAAILIAAIGYGLASPKDSLRSIRRVMSPWADLAAPTRVRFESVTPGNVDKRRDDVVEVSVRVAGLRPSDTVTLFYSASGNPADDLPLAMQSDENRYLWKVTLPPGSEGLKQDLFYYVQAGDAASERFRIRVLSTPVINVRTVRYDYPAYTGLPPRTVERQGDLKALEGTRITLTAEANQPVRGAYVAFDQARNKDVELQPNGLEAVGGFELALGKDRETPLHSSYVLRFTNIDGEENPKPVAHRIDVTADQPPEVRIVEPNSPPEKELTLAVGRIMTVTAAARDPDFQLAELTVVFERAGGGPLREEQLLAEPRYGEFSNHTSFSSESLNLKVGDKFTIRGRAADNKSPRPNVVETSRYTVVVVPGDGPKQPDDKQPSPPREGEAPREPKNEQPQNGKQPSEPAKNERLQPSQNGGEPQPSQNQQPDPNAPPRNDGGPTEQNPGAGGKQGDAKSQQPSGPDENRQPGERPNQPPDQRPPEPIDPNVDPGKAIDELNKHFEQKDKDQGPDNRGQGAEEKKQNKPQEGEAPAEPQGGANQPKQDAAGGQQPKQEDGDQKSGQSPEGGGQPKSDDASGAGKQDGSSGQKQSGPQGGSNADERKAGGSDRGVGRQGAEGAGEKAPGGPAQNQPTKNPGDEAAQPGGQAGQKTDRPPQGGLTERRTGENDGGREAARRPDDGEGAKEQPGGTRPDDPNDRMKQGSGKQQGGDPLNGESGKQPGSNQPGERPDDAPASDGRRPNAEANESRPGVRRDTNSNDSGQGGKSGGDESKPTEQAPRPGEPSTEGTQGKPSDNEKQPGGNTKNPGGMEGPAAKQDGSPQQEEVAKPRDKAGGAESDSGQESKEEKSAGGNSKHESDARGQTSGDRSGDGEDGAGMKSPKQGTGAAGQNTAGEQGGGTSSQEGNQATGDQGGDKVRGNDPSQGKPSDRPGKGTPTEQGGDKAGGDAQGSAKNDAAADAGRGDKQSNAGPGGGATDTSRESQTDDARTVAPPADEANLDYTRQVTELTLDRLKQQLDQGEVDPELLKRFTSREALEEFVRKWDAMRQAAREPGPSGDQAKQKFNETLKSLGLRPGATSQGASTATGDDFRNVRGGRRSEPPAKYADQYRAYTTGFGQGEK